MWAGLICYYIDMAKVALIQVIWNTKHFIPHVFPPALNQTIKDLDFYVVIAGNEDGSKEYIQEHFPQVKIFDPGFNIGFSGGHNKIFSEIDAEFFQLINPDLVVTPNFVEEMLKPFSDPTVGAVSGKILRYDFEKHEPTNIIDTTGVVISKSGRGRDRGQHEVDSGQYNNQTDLIAVSGAAVMYRKSALEDVKYTYPAGHSKAGTSEYFDTEFHTYWEDIDLSWRMINRGWKIKYNPNAVAFHGRAAGSSEGGYKKILSFIKHHSKLPQYVRSFNYKNHIFLFIKNSPKFYLKFFIREFFYQIYVLVLETSTLKGLPQLFRELPSMWQKRKHIKATRKISETEMEKLLV